MPAQLRTKSLPPKPASRSRFMAVSLPSLTCTLPLHCLHLNAMSLVSPLPCCALQVVGGAARGRSRSQERARLKVRALPLPLPRAFPLLSAAKTLPCTALYVSTAFVAENTAFALGVLPLPSAAKTLSLP